MISFLTLPIRLVGIVLLATLMSNAIAPMRSLESKLANLNLGSEAPVIATTVPTSSDAATPYVDWIVVGRNRFHLAGLSNLLPANWPSQQRTPQPPRSKKVAAVDQADQREELAN